MQTSSSGFFMFIDPKQVVGRNKRVAFINPANNDKNFANRER